MITIIRCTSIELFLIIVSLRSEGQNLMKSWPSVRMVLEALLFGDPEPINYLKGILSYEPSLTNMSLYHYRVGLTVIKSIFLTTWIGPAHSWSQRAWHKVINYRIITSSVGGLGLCGMTPDIGQSCLHYVSCTEKSQIIQDEEWKVRYKIGMIGPWTQRVAIN